MSHEETNPYDTNERLAKYDEHAFWETDSNGDHWQRNTLEVWPRNCELRSEHISFCAHLGQGYSVFNLGPVPISPQDTSKYATLMAKALPEGTASDVQVHLVHTTNPNIPCVSHPSFVPTLLLVIRGKAADAVTGNTDQCPMSPLQLAKQHIELMAARRQTILRNTQEVLVHGAVTDTSDLTPEQIEALIPTIQLPPSDVFTFEKLAASGTTKQQYQNSLHYRARLAAIVLQASGISPKTSVYSADKTQLYAYLTNTTCRIDVNDQSVHLVGDYNTHNTPCACVFHGPSRGLTLFTPLRQSSSSMTEHTPPVPESEVGAPVSDIFDIDGLGSELDLSCDSIEEALANRINELVSLCTKKYSIKDCVKIGAHNSTDSKFFNVLACDTLYTPIPILSYSHCYRNFTMIRCSTVASVYVTPLSGSKLYGCMPYDMKSIITQCAINNDYIILDNTPTWREELIKISPGRAPFHFMNETVTPLSLHPLSILSASSLPVVPLPR